MKLGKLLYITAIILMVVMSFTMLYHEWNFFGSFMAFITFTGAVNYVAIEEDNSKPLIYSDRKRRAEYFNSLSLKEQNEYLDRIEKELQESLN